MLQTKPSLPTATLYADIEDPNFGVFHHALSRYAMRGTLSYRVRYRKPQKSAQQQMLLAGYGVELALKKTDYKVMDDREVQNQDDSTERATKSEILLEDEEISDIKPLHAKDVALLGMKAASYVMSHDTKLDSLALIVQDLPKHSATLGTGDINVELADEHAHNREKFLDSGINAIWVNGLQLEDSQVNAFALLEILRKERNFVQRLGRLGLTPTQAIRLLSYPVKNNDQPERFDYRDHFEGGNVIFWLNDLEKDERYKSWSTSVQTVRNMPTIIVIIKHINVA